MDSSGPPTNDLHNPCQYFFEACDHDEAKSLMLWSISRWLASKMVDFPALRSWYTHKGNHQNILWYLINNNSFTSIWYSSWNFERSSAWWAWAITVMLNRNMMNSTPGRLLVFSGRNLSVQNLMQLSSHTLSKFENLPTWPNLKGLIIRESASY